MVPTWKDGKHRPFLTSFGYQPLQSRRQSCTEETFAKSEALLIDVGVIIHTFTLGIIMAGLTLKHPGGITNLS